MELVLDPGYWAERVRKCGGELHRAIFNGSADQFAPLHQRHRETLKVHIGPTDSVLDCGCGYGRLLDAMPDDWRGHYVGVDISPDLIGLARLLHPSRTFHVADLREPLGHFGAFTVGLVCSVRQMVTRDASVAEWEKMQRQIEQVCGRLLFLDYGRWD